MANHFYIGRIPSGWNKSFAPAVTWAAYIKYSQAIVICIRDVQSFLIFAQGHPI